MKIVLPEAAEPLSFRTVMFATKRWPMQQAETIGPPAQGRKHCHACVQTSMNLFTTWITFVMSSLRPACTDATQQGRAQGTCSCQHGGGKQY